MRGYAIAPFAKRKGREQAKPKEPTTKRGMHGEGPGGRSQPSTASLTPSALERQFAIIGEAPAAVIPAKASASADGTSIQRGRATGNSRELAQNPSYARSRNRPFRSAKGARASEAMRAGYARGGAGRPLAAVNSFPHPLRTRTPIRNHRRSASRPSFRRKP